MKPKKNDTKMSDTTASGYSQELRQIYHKYITQNKYTEYSPATHVVDNVPVEAIGNAMKAHTAKRLSELKEKVEELDKDDQFDGMVVWKSDVLQLIEETCS